MRSEKTGKVDEKGRREGREFEGEVTFEPIKAPKGYPTPRMLQANDTLSMKR